MPVPRLIHPVPCKLRKKSTATTAAFDDTFREPVGQVRRKRKPIELIAQHSPKREGVATQREQGVSEEADGYLLFRLTDLRRANVTIERGDLIVELGSGDNAREVNFYIVKFEYRGHYTRPGGATLLKAYYQDRSPSRIG